MPQLSSECQHPAQQERERIASVLRVNPATGKRRAETELRKLRIQVSNPMPGGNNSTSWYRAVRHILHGAAILTSDAPALARLLFTEHRQPLVISAEMKVRATSRNGYDRIDRRMTAREISAIPVVCPNKLLTSRN